MSRKCRGGSCFPAGRAPQIRIDGVLDDRHVWYLTKNGRISGGKQWNRPAHDVFVRLRTPTPLPAPAPRHATASVRTPETSHRFAMLNHSPVRSSRRSVRRLRASHGSTSALRRLSGVSSLGVSSSIGRRAKRAIGQQPAERLEPEAALADVLVPIDAAAARLLRVVQVKDLDAVEADEPIELLERPAVARPRNRCRSRRQAGGRYRGRRRRAAIRRAAR